MSVSNTYAKRFSGPWSDELLRRRIEVKAERLEDLNKMSPDIAAEHLRVALKDVVVPTDGMIAVILQLIDRAKAYCELAYGDERSVLGLVYGSWKPRDDAPAICLTGLAGTGKSAIVDAFCRIFEDSERVEIAGHASFEIRACWRMRIRDRSGFGVMVKPHFRDHNEVKASLVLDVAISEAAAQGIALILPDEFQFITTSNNANSLMVSLLHRLTQIGPPVVFTCNFSMVNSLWRRPPQDRHRLLSKPIIVLPEALGPDWNATVQGCMGVAEEFSELNLPEHARMLHDHTFGIKRCLSTLLVLAYLEMRSTGCLKVGAEHLLTAYRSIAYSTMRCDVENLFLGAINPVLLDKDMKCPLVSVPTDPLPNAVTENPARQAHDGLATQEALRSMITPEAKKILAVIDRYTSETPPSKGKPPKRPAASAENLIGGADRFSQHHRDKP